MQDFYFFLFSPISIVNLIFYAVKKCVPEIFMQGMCFFRDNVLGFFSCYLSLLNFEFLLGMRD